MPRNFAVLLVLLTACSFNGEAVAGESSADESGFAEGTDDGAGDGHDGHLPPPASDSGPTPTTAGSGGDSWGPTGETTDGGSDSGSASSEGTTDTGGAGDTEPLCVSNTECAPDEVCTDNGCMDAWAVPHVASVVTWDEACDGVGLNAFYVKSGGFTSSTNPDCPQAWPGEWFAIPGGGATVEIEFWEAGSGVNPDFLVTTWCWDAGLGCGAMPKDYLHAGNIVIGWGGTWTAELAFEVVR